MFPKKDGPKGRQQRNDKTPKEAQIGFRVPLDLLAYINEIEKEGYSKTEIVLRFLYLARDVVEGLGPEWWDVEMKARKEATSPGKALAELARAGLKKK